MSLGRLVLWDARRGRGAVGLEARSLRACATLRERMGHPGDLSAEESSRLLALFMDLKTYLDQRSDAYMARTLEQIETTLGGKAPQSEVKSPH